MRYFRLSLLIFLSFTMMAIADNWKTFGKGTSLSETTKISSILAQPEQFIGKTVLVEGRVVDVCKKRGCWMELASDKEFQTIRVKVQDGKIVFPLKGKGHLALVEGVVEKLEISKEQMLKNLKRHAKENGETFDPSLAKEKVIYRLRGLGAKIDFSK